MLKVRNMEGSSGREIPNQFIIKNNGAEDLIKDGYFDECEYFGNGDIFNESEV
nr:MAG TPA: hypothetical protein [Caudoviricetes sp.]